jgi:hypothetical protein
MKLILVLAGIILLVGCGKTKTSDVNTYTVIESHASTTLCNGHNARGHVGKTAFCYEPATYVIKHGKVITHAHCGTLLRWNGTFDNCSDFPDATVPIGVPLSMKDAAYNQLDWFPVDSDGRHYQDGVSFVIDSEEVR